MASANEVLSVPLYVGDDGDPYDSADNLPPLAAASQPVYDSLPEAPRCTCCPYGFHVDVGFVKYAEDARRGKYLRHLQQIQKYKARLRHTMDAFYKQHGRYPAMPNQAEQVRGSDSDSVAGEGEKSEEDTFALFGTSERLAKRRDRPQTPSGRPLEVASANSSASSGKEVRLAGVESGVYQRPHVRSRSPCLQCRYYSAHDLPQHYRQISWPSVDPCDLYPGLPSCPQCVPPGALEVGGTVQITKEQLHSIRQQMACSLTRLRELEERAKEVPVLRTRIRLLHEEKRLLELQVEGKERESAVPMKEETIVASSVAQEYAVPGPRLVDTGVGGGDVRGLYFLQEWDSSDQEAVLPARLLHLLHSRWQATFLRSRGGEDARPAMLSVAVGGASPTAEVGQFVDMDDEEWSLQESSFSSTTTHSLASFQQKIASSREQRSIVQTLRSAYQSDSVAFKNLIVQLLAKSVRSQATQARPEHADAGDATEPVSRRDVGVSDHRVDVVVRPFVQLFSIGTDVRPHTANKLVLTERVFRHDAGTNTAPGDAVSVGVATEAEEHAVFFTLATQTDAVRTRERAVETEAVQEEERAPLLHAATNTDELARHSVAVGGAVSGRAVDVGVETERPNLYEAAVSTEQVLTFEKEANTPAVSFADDEPEVSESWEEYSVTDSATGRLLHQEVTPVSRSSSTFGQEAGSAVSTSGGYEFGGGTVRSGAETVSVRQELSKQRHASEQVEAAVEKAYARSRMPLSSAAPRPLPPDPNRDFFADLIGPQSESSSVRGSKVDVKMTDFYTSCKTLARWSTDSTTTTSKQMNEAEANIRQAWFRLSGSRASRPEVVEPYLSAVKELGSAVLERVSNLADANGNTAMHYAVSQANWPMVALLLRSCPVHLDRLNRTGYSALMLAALCDLPSQRYPTLAVDLARAADNVDLQSSSGAGQTALMLAASHGRTAMVEALLASGADPNIKDKEGSSALMCASEHGHLEVVRALLARPNTDATATDGEGSTALSIAMENNHRDIALLIYARTNLGKPSGGSSGLLSKGSSSSPSKGSSSSPSKGSSSSPFKGSSGSFSKSHGKTSSSGSSYKSRKNSRSVFEKFMPIRRIKEEDF